MFTCAAASFMSTPQHRGFRVQGLGYGVVYLGGRQLHVHTAVHCQPLCWKHEPCNEEPPANTVDIPRRPRPVHDSNFRVQGSGSSVWDSGCEAPARSRTLFEGWILNTFRVKVDCLCVWGGTRELGLGVWKLEFWTPPGQLRGRSHCIPRNLVRAAIYKMQKSMDPGLPCDFFCNLGAL